MQLKIKDKMLGWPVRGIKVDSLIQIPRFVSITCLLFHWPSSLILTTGQLWSKLNTWGLSI